MGFKQINFTHPSVMSLLQNLQNVNIYSKELQALTDDETHLQVTEPLDKVSSIRTHSYKGVSLFFLNMPNLTRMEYNWSDLIPKIERIPQFFNNSPLLQDVKIWELHDSHLQMILDTCSMLKKIDIIIVKADPDF